MAKRSKEEIQKLMAELEEELNSPDLDDDEEVWVESDGVKFRLTGDKAKRFLAKHSKHWSEDEVEEIPKKRTPAKKTAAPKKVIKATEEEMEELEDDVEEQLEEDPKPQSRSYWG